MSPVIPIDIYESPQELLFVIPLGGIHRDSIKLQIQDYKLIMIAHRVKPELKESLVSLQEECYRGPIEQTIDLPSNIVYDQIHSSLTKENILHIILPKYTVPDQIQINIQD